MKITVLRPDVPPPAVASVALAPRRELPERPVIGVISNGKPLAKELLDALVLRDRARGSAATSTSSGWRSRARPT